jgi:hypothetical protein
MALKTEILITAIFFCGVAIIAGYFSFESGKETGYSDGFAAGYLQGFEKGNISGFYSGETAGFQKGYDEGKAAGREEGFKLGYAEGNETGYTIGYDEGRAKGFVEGKNEGQQLGYALGYSTGLNDSIPHKYALRDPTYDEVIEFLARDKTDRNTYIEENFQYVCIDYAIDVCSNAQKQHLDCHVVELVFKEAEGAHVIVAFNTIDKGWVFFEPQDDRKVKVGIGVHYYKDNNYISDIPDDTIIKVNIIP